jgi:hypothetical protein
MLDADGATDYNDIEKIYKITVQNAKSSSKNLSCSIGSRNINQDEVKRTPLRKFLNFMMQKLCGFVLGSPFKDT